MPPFYFVDLREIRGVSPREEVSDIVIDQAFNCRF